MKEHATYYELTNFSSPEIEPHLALWSQKTNEEPDLLYRSVESLRQDLLHAVFAFSGTSLVGMSGIVACPDRHQKSMYTGEGRLVAELMGRYVEPEFRGIGFEMIRRRIRFSIGNNWFPISVTKNSIATATFLKMGAYEMTPDHGAIYHEIPLLRMRSRREAVPDLSQGRKVHLGLGRPGLLIRWPERN